MILGRFTALMAPPWLVAIAVEHAGFRLFFARDLRSEPVRSRAGRGTRVSVSEFTRLGRLTGPAAIVAATVALWTGLRI